MRSIGFLTASFLALGPMLHAAGEDNEKHGDLPAAQAQFEEARRTTAALLAAKPNDPQRIFDHAQSEYWVGFINWRKGDGATAKSGFEAYAKLADRLVLLDPKNETWLMEKAYAANNLGMLALRQAGQPREAQADFAEALRIRRLIAKHKPGDPEVLKAIANALAWVADSERIAGDLTAAKATREEQHVILTKLLEEKPGNVPVENALLGYELAVARIDAAKGEWRATIRRLDAGERSALQLARSDSENKDFAKQARMFELFKVRTWLDMPPRERPRLPVVANVLRDCRTAAPALSNQEIDDFCDVLLARVRSQSGDRVGAELAMAPVRAHAIKQHDVLTAHWGLNLPEETRSLQVAYSGGTK